MEINMSKCSAVLLILLLVSSSYLMSSLVCASTAKPSVPEFTLKYVVAPYNVPPAFRINPYTGENETLSVGYSGWIHHIEITVKNQPFNPYIDTNGNTVNIFYNVSLKGHHQDVWGSYPTSTYENLFNASNSDCTVIQVERGYPSIPIGGKLDFRLEALIGYYNYNRAPSGTEYVTGFSVIESSGWSNIQTITVPASSAISPTPTLPPDSTPTQDISYPNTSLFENTQLTIIAVVVAIFVVIIASLLLYVKALKKQETKPPL